MKTAATLILAVMFAASASYLSVDFDPSDDDKLAATVAIALSGNESAELTRVTGKVFKMQDPTAQLCYSVTSAEQHSPHGDKYLHVYTNKLGLKPIQSGNGKYPVGSIIIKQKFSDIHAKNTELFTVMRKMDSGYDSDNGDWEYSVLNSSATSVLSRGKTDSCIACHADYSSTDYVTRTYIK